jgi:hypothetical protein
MTTMSDRDYARVVRSLRGGEDTDIDQEAYRAEVRRVTASINRSNALLEASNEATRQWLADNKEYWRQQDEKRAASSTHTSADTERTARLDHAVEDARVFRRRSR